MQFPIGVFGVAISVATLPTVSAHVARGDIAEFRATLARSLRLAIFLCVPAACGLVVLAEPIIAAIYQHGRFDAAATAQTVWCLRAFALGLAGYAAIKVIAPTFYALGDARTPALVSLTSIFVNAALCYVFSMALGLGVPGLALSTSCVALTNFVLLLALMRRKIERIEVRALLRSLAKIATASAAMSLAAYGTHIALAGNRYVDMAASMAVALIVFASSCRLLRIEEFGELMRALSSRKL